MFQKSSEEMNTSNDSSTIIGPSVRVEGDLHAIGNVTVEGIINGTLETDKDVSIGQNAEITADVKAQNATVAGIIKGKIDISNHLTIKSSANITGDINTQTISIDPGGQINGQLKMGGSPRVEPAEDRSDEEE